MKASKMIDRLQKLIEEHGDLDVSMLTFVTNGNETAEMVTPIRQVKYRKRLNKFFTDFTGGF